MADTQQAVGTRGVATEEYRVAVIGAGLGGLSVAARLAAAGYEVHVYDKQAGPGGKAFTEHLGPYRFDTGPSLFTMRHVFDQLFDEVGEDLDEYLDLRSLEVICRYFWNDGTRLSAFQDPDRLAAEFQDRLEEPAENVRRFLEYSKEIYEVTNRLFLWRSLHEASTYMSKSFFSSVFKVGRIDAFRTMNAAVEAHFQTDKARQYFNRYATYNGSSPYLTPATLNIIPHVEYGIGAYGVGDGIYAVPLALERLARKMGAVFHYNTRVDRICVEKRFGGRRVTGIQVGGTELEFGIVVSNADVTPTYRDLLEDDRSAPIQRYAGLEPSSSGLVFYWGMGRSFPELGLHNIFFSSDYRREFDEIFDEHRCPTEPTVYVNITSKITPQDAPAGGENWFVLVNAPYDKGQDWEAEASRVRESVIRRLSYILETDLEAAIEEEGRMTPPEIEARTDSNRGSLYGISSNSRMAAFARHPNRSRDYRGLYFCGGSAHPGGGMPLAVLSGKIASDLVRAHGAR